MSNYQIPTVHVFFGTSAQQVYATLEYIVHHFDNLYLNVGLIFVHNSVCVYTCVLVVCQLLYKWK